MPPTTTASRPSRSRRTRFCTVAPRRAACVGGREQPLLLLHQPAAMVPEQRKPFFLPPIACVLTLASVLRGAVPEDEEGDDEEVPDAPRSSKKKEKKRQEREAQRQVGCSLQCCVLSWAPTSAYLASHRLLNCVPLIGTSHCNFGCTGRFSSSTVCISVCCNPNSVYICLFVVSTLCFCHGLHTQCLAQANLP